MLAQTVCKQSAFLLSSLRKSMNKRRTKKRGLASVRLENEAGAKQKVNKQCCLIIFFFQERNNANCQKSDLRRKVKG